MTMSSSTRQITKADKMAMLSGAMAVQIARETNDPLYAKLVKAKGLYMKYKEMVQNKYGQKGALAARKIASGNN